MQVRRKVFSRLSAAMAVGIAVMGLVGAAGAQTPNIWDGTADISWYTGTEAQAFNIDTPEKLAGLAQLVNGGVTFDGQTITLGADIFLNDTTGSTSQNFDPEDKRVWTPIGNNSRQFRGEFDGLAGIRNRRIYGLYIPNGGTYQGLFGYTTALISNLDLFVGTVTGTNYVGGVAGYGANIRNVHSDIVVSGNNYVGGLAGWVTEISRDSYSTADVSGSGYVGGLTGNGNISDSYSTGNIIGSGSYIGGLTGNGSVNNSYSTGNVTAGSSSNYVGGLTGSGNVTSSYFIGNVSGNDYVGGIAGSGNVTGTAADTGYTTFHKGKVKGRNFVGGLSGNATTVTNAYHQDSVVATGNKVGGVAGYVSGNISSAHSIGNVVGMDSVGGLVGYHQGQVLLGTATATGFTTFSRGNVNGRNYVGGLIGHSRYSSTTANDSIVNIYAIGNVSGNNYVGGLLGYSLGYGYNSSNSFFYKKNIKNAYAQGDVSGNNLYVGGLAGNVSNGDIITANHEGNVNGMDYVGGLVGYHVGQALVGVPSRTGHTTYSRGNVNGRNYVGGLVGYSRYLYENIADNISNVYVIGDISGNGYVGGLLGYNEGYNSSYGKNIMNVYSQGNVSGDSVYVGGLVGYISNGSIVMASRSNGNVNGKDFVGGLVGSTNGSITASNFSDGNVAGLNQVGGLVGNISGAITSSYIVGGSVDGVDTVGGLVGRSTSAITNAYSHETAVRGRNTVGGLAGLSSGAITGSYSNGNVRGVFEVGGLAGNRTGTSVIDSCYSNSNVIGDDNVGGLVGSLRGTVRNSFATGSVTGDEENSSAGNDNLGGLVGYSYNGSILRSFATGNVIGTARVGGLAGRADGTTINQAYARGNVTATIYEDDIGSFYAGGLVGFVGSGTSIYTESYASGAVSALAFVGGFVGENHGTLTFTNCHYDVTSSTQSSGVGYTTSPVTGLVGNTTVEMKTNATFSNWDWNTTWDIKEAEGYPYLGWQNNSIIPQIIVQPVDGIVDVGVQHTLFVVASARDGDDGTLSYQWYRNTAKSNSDGVIIAGATEAFYTPGTAEAGFFYYYVIVTNTTAWAVNTQTASVSSNAVALAVGTESYKIIFDANGGTIDITSDITQGRKLMFWPTPTRSGYTFSGWFTVPTGGVPITEFTDDATIYAQWTISDATFVFEQFTTSQPSAWWYSGFTRQTTGGVDGSASMRASINTDNTQHTITIPNVILGEKASLSLWRNLVPSVLAQLIGLKFDKYVYISTNSGATYTSLDTATVWTNGVDRYDLSSYANQNVRLQIRFSRIEGADFDVYIDDITILGAVYTVSFHANGGTVSTASATTGSTPTTWKKLTTSLPTPTREGYIFNGWFTAITGGTQVTASTEYSANTVAYAQWSPICTITFDANYTDGTVTPTSGMTGVGGTLASLPTPTRSGYGFNGWFTAAAGGTEVTTNTVFDADATIYAQWTFGIYTITFDANGGTVTPISNTTAEDESGRLASLPMPTRTGYVFGGWYTAATGGTAITLNTVYSASTTIYAQWAIDNPTFIFEYFNTSAPAEWTYSGFSRITSDGYNYSACLRARINSSSTTASVMIPNVTLGENAQLEYYASWTGGSIIINAEISTNGGTTWVRLSRISRNGNNFVDDLSNHANQIVAIRITFERYNSDLDIYLDNIEIIGAIYTITFDANGGAVNPAFNTTSIIPLKLISLPTPTRPDYAFNGWFTAPTGGTQVTTSTEYSANTVLYARWVPSYTVTFDANGGTTAAPATTGANKTLASLPASTKTGYTFNGWFTEKTGGTQVTTSTIFDDDAIIYAQWTLTNYTITYNLNSGTNHASNPADYTVENSTITFQSPTRDGYTFGGWYDNAGLTGDAVTAIATGSTGNKVYWARWTLITNAATPTVTAQPVGGTVTVGTARTLSVSASISDGGTLSYQWYSNTTANNIGGTAIAGAASATYSPSTATVGTFYYYVVVTNTNSGVNGATTATLTSAVVTLSVGATVSIQTPDRTVPGYVNDEDAAVVAPSNAFADGFTAGPNIVRRGDGAVTIYRVGAAIGRPRSAGDNVLTVYDAQGNVVTKISLSGNVPVSPSSPQSPGNNRRVVGSWDLRDAKGRPVPEGTYLLRGAVRASDGGRERVSLMVSVR